MNNIRSIGCVLVITIIGILAFGPPHPIQVAQAETAQFSCASVTEIPQIECEALVAIYNGTAELGRYNRLVGTRYALYVELSSHQIHSAMSMI